jgi:hypothetical protein
MRVAAVATLGAVLLTGCVHPVVPQNRAIIGTDAMTGEILVFRQGERVNRDLRDEVEIELHEQVLTFQTCTASGQNRGVNVAVLGEISFDLPDDEAGLLSLLGRSGGDIELFKDNLESKVVGQWITHVNTHLNNPVNIRNSDFIVEMIEIIAGEAPELQDVNFNVRQFETQVAQPAPGADLWLQFAYTCSPEWDGTRAKAMPHAYTLHVQNPDLYETHQDALDYYYQIVVDEETAAQELERAGRDNLLVPGSPVQ